MNETVIIVFIFFQFVVNIMFLHRMNIQHKWIKAIQKLYEIENSLKG